MDQRLTRTYLAVPAHRASLVRHAAASAADAVFLDLEDAVPESEKIAALEGAASALQEVEWGRKTVSVRLNAIESPTHQEEVGRLGELPRLDAVILPKAERLCDVTALASRLAQAANGRTAPVQIELLIETAFGLLNVGSLAGADPAVAALHLGVGDLAASIGARSPGIGLSPEGYIQVGEADGAYEATPLDLFAYPMMAVLVAARAFGLRAIDGPCGAFRDMHLTSTSARKAASMGFDGKQVIHPSQIDVTRDAFVPSEAELEHARRVVAAMDRAEREGIGAVMVDGRMIDYANLRMIRRLLRFAA